MYYEIISETFEVVKGEKGRFAECLQFWEKGGKNSEFGIRNSELWRISFGNLHLIVSRFARRLKGNVFAVDW